MLTRSLLQCRACRLTWFPQGGAVRACPACGGTKVGGTLEFFHAGLALIVLGLIGWWLRHGQLGERPVAAVPAAVQTKQLTASVERGTPVYVSSKKVKPSKVKRRQKKAKTRSKHVQR